jgi:hypothetical protein
MQRTSRPLDVPRSVIYLSKQTHHSIDKRSRRGPGRIDPTFYSAGRSIQEWSRRNSKNISKKTAWPAQSVHVVGIGRNNGCGRDRSASRDRFYRKRAWLWYHVDAAYGGFFILTKDGREKLQGIELSDSLIIDPHKGLFLPYGLGVVLVKNVEDLKRSFRFDAHYMQDAFAGPDELSPAELSPELTKHFRGLRLWLPLKLHGIAPFRACLEEKLMLAQYFYEEVQKIGFECPACSGAFGCRLPFRSHERRPERISIVDFSKQLSRTAASLSHRPCSTAIICFVLRVSRSVRI